MDYKDRKARDVAEAQTGGAAQTDVIAAQTFFSGFLAA